MAQKFVSESVSLILMYLYVDRQQKERVRHEKISTHCLHQTKIDRYNTTITVVAFVRLTVSHLASSSAIFFPQLAALLY